MTVYLSSSITIVVNSLDSTYLLATCYYRSGRVQQAKHLLSKARDQATTTPNPHCNLLYARCCLDLKEYVSSTCIPHLL